MAEGQVKYSFDSETRKKILRSIFYAAILPAVIVILEQLGVVDWGNTTINAILAWVIPIVINAIREWIKGQETSKVKST